MGNDINNENFYDNGYYYSLSYPPHTPAPTPSPTFYFNNNDNGLPGNDIVEYTFGIDCYEYGFEYGMYFFDRIFLFFPKTLFVVLVEFVNLLLNYYQLDHSLFLFFQNLYWEQLQ